MAGTNKVVPQNSLGEFNIPTNTRNWEQENGLVRIKNNQNGNNDEGGTRSCPDGTDACWDLSYMPEADSYYYLSSGGAGDTFAVVFTPAAPCIVQEVYQVTGNRKMVLFELKITRMVIMMKEAQDLVQMAPTPAGIFPICLKQIHTTI